MPATHTDWTREQHILAFNLSRKIPFGRQQRHAPESGRQGPRTGCAGMC